MPQEQTDERRTSDDRERELGERLASWWNQGAEEPTQNQDTSLASQTAKREAA